MKKILLIINSLGVGGAERVFVSDVNHLHKSGYDVSFVVLYGENKDNPLLHDIDIPNEKIYCLKGSNIFDAKVYLNLWKVIKKIDANIIYSTLNDAIFISRIVSIFSPKVFLVTREANTTEFKSLSHKIADIFMNWRANVMAVVSEQVKNSLVSYQPWCKKKVEVIYNGVSIPNYESKYLDTKTDILCVGSLTKKKNHIMLLDSVLKIKKNFPKVILKIVGDGVLRKSLEEYVLKNNLSENVTFLGKIEYSEVVNLYKESGIFVLSSDQEGCPNVLLEAMSYGLPCVATHVGAVGEIIDSDLFGIVVPRREPTLFANGIEKLLTSVATRQSVGLAGRDQIIKHFSIEVHMEKLKDILHI